MGDEMIRPLRVCCIALCLTFSLLALSVSATEKITEKFTEQIRQLDPGVVVLGTVRQPPLAGMLGRDHAARLRRANTDDRLGWEKVRNLDEWERFREVRIQALRQAMGIFPKSPSNVKVHRTGTLRGEGYQVDKLVVETRPDLLMTANLYRPARPTESMPGVLIVHSHQQPKHVGWRQDICMTWARAGCVVMVPDLVGHGERRQHPFPEPHPHDYHFRFDAGMQFSLIGDSLMGWFVWDLMRAVDVLLDQPGVDAERILAISEPAGGGDVAAVTTALDPRIAGAVINNFGGPQPESPYPLPPDAEISFGYAGYGSWESTRCLRLSARDGFLPWLIVGSIAPRRVVYYHEFYWDQQHDPVWPRLQKIWGWYNASDNLTGLAGHGFVVGSAPENTHWLPESRELLYPVLERWFKIPNPRREYSQRLPEEELFCMTEALRTQHQPAHQLAAKLGEERANAAREKLLQLPLADRRAKLQRDWAALLGNVAPGQPSLNGTREPEAFEKFRVDRLHLASEPGIVVPSLLLVPARSSKETRPPVVIGLAQSGKQEFLKQRAGEIAMLLDQGVAVCLPDVRGTGETSVSDARDRRSASTSLAAGEMMLGETVLGGQLRDVRTLLVYLRSRQDLNGRRIALWGESFAPQNADDVDIKVPYTADSRPAQAEPLGGLLALLGGLFEADVRCVVARGCLADYQSLLQSPFTYVAFDAVVPGALTVGDLPGLATGLAPRGVWIASAVDGVNQRVPADELTRLYAPAAQAYKSAGKANSLTFEDPSSGTLAKWLIQGLR